MICIINIKKIEMRKLPTFGISPFFSGPIFSVSRKMPLSLSRRRTLKLVAAAAGLASAPMRAFSIPNKTRYHPVSWNGRLMGLDASIQLFHPDRAEGEKILHDTVALVRQQETLFSLYQPGSALRRLNSTGFLENPPPDFIRLLRYARRISTLTRGKFDVTVQPLWAFYQNHFLDPSQTEPPQRAAIDAVLEHVGYQHLSLEGHLIQLTKPGMALTLNGIAQGFVTDMAAAHLRRNGLEHVLVDFGELRALGPQPDGAAWNIGLEDPLAPLSLAEVVQLRKGALATSGGYGDRFDSEGRFHHLLDPTTGLSSHHYRAITVQAPTALEADALSTAFYVMSPEEIKSLLTQYRHLTVRLTLPDGTLLRLAS